VSLEESGGPSAFVIKTHALEETDRAKVKEALCYLAPEQTGSVENMAEDHRTDLYSLGIFFWTLLVGRGTSPFEGGPLQLLHAIVQKQPMPVHEIRRDVPQVLAAIVEKVTVFLLLGFPCTDSDSAPFQKPGSTISERTGCKE
jgi:serine/threonine protein kinase